MSVTLQDILNLTGDYAASNTGQADEPRQIRQINVAIEYFQRKGLLPNNEDIQSFYFNDDQFFYACNTDFMEEVQLLYHNPDLNTAEREWEFLEYSLLLKRSGHARTKNQWSFTTINGTRQLILMGRNIQSGAIIDGMEEVGTWVVQGDASSLELDQLDFKYGDGSLSFDVSAYSTGLAGINDPSVSLNFETLFEKHGYVKCWAKFPSAAIDAVRFRFYVTASKYWTITVTAQDDGTAFVANTQMKLGFALDNAVKTGLPLITDTITKIELEVDLTASTTGSNFRFDHIFTTVPDYMDLIYRSHYKGTDTLGTTSRLNLSAVTDILGVGELFPDIADLIARRASLNLWPQLRGDKDFMLLYKEELKELMRDVGMRFPRKRTNKFLPTRLKR